MHHTQLEIYQHSHKFNIEKKSAERKTLIVFTITMSTMMLEIVFGWIFNSMALFSDGWHMLTHATALGISLLAYILARKQAENLNYVFGTWKIEILGAYTSAIFLGMVGIFVLIISVIRFFKPAEISYLNALLVAFLGLLVNMVSVAILRIEPEHSHEHHHNHNGDSHHHSDLNLKSAYLHVLADAMTSIFAIFALLGAYLLHWNWLDPMMGLVGAFLILRWTISLVKETSGILLDREAQSDIKVSIKSAIEGDGDSRVSDLHLWRVAQNRFSCILSLVALNPAPLNAYKERLKNIDEISHLTIEINSCR
jgi:cation diffusion facilitator family transporter